MRDPIQPWTQRRVSLVALQRLERMDEGRLHRVLGVRFGPQDRSAIPEQRPVIALVDNRISEAAARRRRSSKLLVAEPARSAKPLHYSLIHSSLLMTTRSGVALARC